MLDIIKYNKEYFKYFGIKNSITLLHNIKTSKQ